MTPPVTKNSGLQGTDYQGDPTIFQRIPQGIQKKISAENIYFRDKLTGNASISKHGFLPKLTGDITKFLNGLGGWSTISSASMNFLQTEIDFGASLFPENITITILDPAILSTSVVTMSMAISSTRDFDEMEFTNFTCSLGNIIDNISYDITITDLNRQAEGKYLLNIMRN